MGGDEDKRCTWVRARIPCRSATTKLGVPGRAVPPLMPSRAGGPDARASVAQRLPRAGRVSAGGLAPKCLQIPGASGSALRRQGPGRGRPSLIGPPGLRASTPLPLRVTVRSPLCARAAATSRTGCIRSRQVSPPRARATSEGQIVAPSVRSASSSSIADEILPESGISHRTGRAPSAPAPPRADPPR